MDHVLPLLLAYSDGVLYGGIACVCLAIIVLCQRILEPTSPCDGHRKVYIDYDVD